MPKAPVQSNHSNQSWGPARYVKLGHLPTDTFVVKQAKSILVLVLSVFIVFASIFFFDPGRSAFVHFIDAVVVISAIAIITVLHFTHSLKTAYAVASSVSLLLICVFMVTVGNRGADLMLALFFPLMAVITVGPKQSRFWVILYVIVVVGTYLIDQNLPQVNWDIMKSADNPTGSLFHAPYKTPLTANALVIGMIGTVLAYAMVYAAYAQLIHSRDVIAKQRVELAASYLKSENLLRNILPESVADRLKEDPTTRIADDLDDVAILIADLVNFTELSSNKSAAQVVDMLNRVFTEFDKLVKQLGLEKIKTSGDAYMVAAGISVHSSDDLTRMAQVALAMVKALQTVSADLDTDLSVRIGIHSGLATAGVVGTLKFYYDIWGDTVNTAARLQSSAMPNSIRVSEQVYQSLRADFIFEEMPISALKGKGQVVTYRLIGQK